ncbi:DUF2167 domain-containing protein [Diaphorobacter aerolatus]|uniref:DUF2167 domain-containing protein n=1 Tax=Diaphorobacter aerolatus TaxID=1288495 RepID=A0A7H0GJN0_9BURK|nr:DUF2167 domain-containing protein [Diaphorobacter aerolatus]QNP48496.1 DUF2167 domain-containing protein [Diaphorobacter aerolatus]
MIKKIAGLMVGLALAFGAAAQDGEDSKAMKEIQSLQWQKGGTGQIASMANIKVPADYGFLGDRDTSKFLQIAGNPPRSDHYLIAPANLGWFAIFNFDDSGYVKDDEKIDSADLLKSIKSSDAAGNKERKRLGLPAIYTDGWAVEPHYDNATKRLEWGLRLRDESGRPVVNYTSRLLGRSGVMEATLVTDPETMTTDVAQFQKVLTGFEYNGGHKYSEFKKGDKVAAFGLAALVLGGAAAVATKKGFWAVLGGFFAAGWKFIVAAVVALGAGIGKLFKRDKSSQ